MRHEFSEIIIDILNKTKKNPMSDEDMDDIRIDYNEAKREFFKKPRFEANQLVVLLRVPDPKDFVGYTFEGSPIEYQNGSFVINYPTGPYNIFDTVKIQFLFFLYFHF